MAKLNLAFKNERELSKHEIKTCHKVIDIIINEEYPTGSQISKALKIAPADVRHYIKLIREYNSLFFDGHYIVAYQSGYAITNNKKVLKKYFNKLQAMTHSKVKQSNELLEVLNGN